MPKQITPTICAGGLCRTMPQNHCKECSHAIYERIIKLDGKKYKMHFKPRFGPLFTRANQTKKEPDWTPGCRHKLWKAAAPAMNRIVNQKNEIKKPLSAKDKEFPGCPPGCECPDDKGCSSAGSCP